MGRFSPLASCFSASPAAAWRCCPARRWSSGGCSGSPWSAAAVASRYAGNAPRANESPEARSLLSCFFEVLHPMNVIHLTSSQFHGGPERQMLGLAQALPDEYRTSFVSFSEKGRCHAFLDMARRHGFEAIALKHDTLRLLAARRELVRLFCRYDADIVCCHGYKANVLGRMAAQRVGIPVVAVSRGWTAENLRVRFYEAVDRLNLRWMNHVVCVSYAQAEKVRRAGVPAECVSVIRNA